MNGGNPNGNPMNQVGMVYNIHSNWYWGGSGERLWIIQIYICNSTTFIGIFIGIRKYHIVYFNICFGLRGGKDNAIIVHI